MLQFSLKSLNIILTWIRLHFLHLFMDRCVWAICQEAGSSNPNIRILYHHHPHILRFVRFVSAWPEALAALRNRPPVNIDLVIWMLKDVFTNCNKENYIFFTGSEKTAAVWSSLSLFFFYLLTRISSPTEQIYHKHCVCQQLNMTHIYSFSSSDVSEGEVRWGGLKSDEQFHPGGLLVTCIRKITDTTYLSHLMHAT